jgi:hypothetical protein
MKDCFGNKVSESNHTHHLAFLLMDYGMFYSYLNISERVDKTLGLAAFQCPDQCNDPPYNSHSEEEVYEKNKWRIPMTCRVCDHRRKEIKR